MCISAYIGVYISVHVCVYFRALYINISVRSTFHISVRSMYVYKFLCMCIYFRYVCVYIHISVCTMGVYIFLCALYVCIYFCTYIYVCVCELYVSMVGMVGNISARNAVSKHARTRTHK